MSATMRVSAAAAFLFAATTLAAQARTLPETVPAAGPEASSGNAGESMFQLSLATPSGELGRTGGVGGGIGLMWQRTFAVTQHMLGLRLDLPVAAGTSKGSADQGWSFMSPAIGIVVSPPRERLYVLPYAFGSVSWNRVSAFDLVTSDEVAETGMGSAFGVGVELPVFSGRLAVEYRAVSAGLDGWTAQASTLTLGFVSGGIRPAKR